MVTHHMSETQQNHHLGQKANMSDEIIPLIPGRSMLVTSCKAMCMQRELVFILLLDVTIHALKIK